MTPAQALRTRLGKNGELTADFLFVFARFEYALKSAGFVVARKDAQPGWDRFAKEIGVGIDKDRLQEVAGYLIQSPPLKQVVFDQSLGWEPDGYDGDPADVVRVVALVRRVRNNLFHGAKFHHFDPPNDERDVKLILCGLALLDAFLALDGAVAVRTAFLDGHATVGDFALGVG